jgi:membrane protein YdbS with pleckstrin-like domain
LKVVIFLLSAFNVFMVGLAGYSAVLWGFNALVAVFCFCFIVNAVVSAAVIRGKVFSEEVLLNDKFN